MASNFSSVRRQTGSSVRWRSLAAGAAVLTSLTTGGLTALAAGVTPRLPVIQNVGVVPVQWENGAESDPALDAGRIAAEQAFPLAVRAARRFRVLGDDLVAGAWSTQAGREELRQDFELHAFVSLTATPRGDTLVLTTRLMDSWLKGLLIETDTVQAAWLQSAGADGIRDRLETLVFRMFNRLPVDVSVTSVQGGFVTLSGGSDQGIEPGDKVDLVRTTIRSVHPANGTWLDFERRAIGTAQIVDVKTYNSVAKITSAVRPGALEVGDGARIGAIAGRLRFQRLAAAEGLKESGSQKPIVVPPLYLGNQPAAQPAAPGSTTLIPLPKAPAAGGTQETAAAPAPAPGAEGEAAVKTPASGATSEVAASDPAPAGKEGPSIWDTVAEDATSHKLVDSAYVQTGPYWWSVKGPTNSSGRFPLWLVNSLSGGISRTMLFKFKSTFGAGILFGKTPHGSYFGYDMNAGIYWEDDLVLADGLIKYWRAGGYGRFSGMSVPDGPYGGGDWLRGGGYGHLGGTLNIGGPDGLYDWFGEFAMMPLVIGRVGYDGSRKAVESAFGWKLSLGAFKQQPPHIIQWGGGIDIADERQTLKNGRRLHFQEYLLKAIAKYTF